jgi:hypothetical protein
MSKRWVGKVLELLWLLKSTECSKAESQICEGETVLNQADFATTFGS